MTARPFLRSIACLSLLIIALPLGSAQNGAEDEAWGQEDRSLRQTVGKESFVVTSTRTSALGQDRIEVAFSLADATIRYTFTSIEPGNETSLQMLVALDSAVEFADADGDGRYGLGDETVQVIPLEGAADGVIVTDPLAGGGFAATARFALRDAAQEDPGPIGGGSIVAGQLQATFRFGPETRIEAGEEIDPTEFATDLLVERFPFRREDTSLAVVTRVATVRAADLSIEDAPPITVQDGPFRVLLGWTAPEDDPARATTITSGDDTRVAFAWPRGQEYAQHLRLQAAREAALIEEVIRAVTKGDPLTYAVAAVGALALAGGPALWRRGEGR